MIREIRKEDYPAVLEIYNYYILNSTCTFEVEPLSLEEFSLRIEKIRSEYPYLVDEENGVIKGYAYLDHYSPRKAYDISTDLSIYVSHDFLHEGIGQKLYEAIEAEAKERGFHNIISIITDKNTDSVSFHQKNGFVHQCHLENVAIKFHQDLGIFILMKRIK